MLGMKPFLQPYNSTPFSPHLFTTTTFFQIKPQKTNSNACSNLPFSQFLKYPFLVPVFLNQGRNGVLVSAAKKPKKGTQNFTELDDFDELYEEDEENDDDEEGVYIPLSGMTEWFDKKPSGFGEGKEYDTALEDKLMEELEQSRKAQAANLSKLKNNPSMLSSKESPVTKAPEPVPSGVRVRVGNLPKKKNILRDLQLVFKGFPALANISPAVAGNKKTKDPICKGFAFVDLGSVEAANRFVQTYSKKSITFGKIQKQITCELTNFPASKQSSPKYTPGQRLPRMDLDSDTDSDVTDITLELRETPANETSVQDQQFLSEATEELEEDIAHINLSESRDTLADESNVQDQQFLSEITEELEENIGHIYHVESRETPAVESIVQDQQLLSETMEEPEDDAADMNLLEANGSENVRSRTADKTHSSSSKQQQKKRALKKKQTGKGKSDKSPQLKIPGSTKRLRVKEKAVLAGVFSKYGSETSLSLTKAR